jgi:peptidoglycan/LPS O-acetylase OafA/YrhL
MRRIKNLDGLRGLAILMVVAGHAAANYEPLAAGPRRWLTAFANSGGGVRLFFVLSGYLITKLLLDEGRRHGRISLSQFYRRRVVRIFPAYYAYLAALALWAWWRPIAIGWRSWVAAATFTWNYSSRWVPAGEGNVWDLGHTWTLAMEQQFYLLWPVALVLLGPRRALWAALALVVWCPLARVGSYFLFPDQRGALTLMFHTGSDSLMMGCAAALLLAPAGPGFPPEWLRGRGAAVAAGSAAWLLLVSPVASELIRGFPVAAGYTLDAAAAAWIVAWADLHPSPGASRLLSSRLLTGLGVLSYSLYLWQQPFLAPGGWLSHGRLILPLGGALAAAGLSLWLIERPCLRWQARRQAADRA